MKKNIFCDKNDLTNESSVEQFFIIRLLKDLGYEDRNIRTKEFIQEFPIRKGKKRKSYSPDYIIYMDRKQTKPVIVIDAKSPKENAENGIADSQFYVAVLRRKLKKPKPEQFCAGTNGIEFIVKHYESNEIILKLNFADFQKENHKYKRLKSLLSFFAVKNALRQPDKSAKKKLFEFRKPDIREIDGIFRACHKIIWKSEKSSKTFAFYEFAKIMFVKLNEDKKLRKNKELWEMVSKEEGLPEEKIIFSRKWIEEREEEDEKNPVDSILFKNLRDELEMQIEEKKKKRIFDKNERIRLNPSTIKETVKMLQHLNLISIDEDLNGRLFETFLSATVRGADLGQFFTPRNVAEFMTKMANLRVDKEHIDVVLDACCGTAGFLIEAMALMKERIEKNDSLSDEEKRGLTQELKEECLYGIDAGKDPPIARIARINMYLHGDGGSKIYQLDSLDKKIEIENGLDPELRKDMKEFSNQIIREKKKFDVVLTNPPFAMKYEKKKPNEKKILEQYDLAYVDNTKKLRASLKSMVMFLERYCDLLKPHGKLITIIDESILNTTSNKVFRDYIKRKFIIKAIISLPKNTFVSAESGVKTSVLYLTKKEKKDETQPKVFMAISENVGHSDSGKPTPEKKDLNEILLEFRKFEKGKL